jgi:hypothetical protein
MTMVKTQWERDDLSFWRISVPAILVLLRDHTHPVRSAYLSSRISLLEEVHHVLWRRDDLLDKRFDPYLALHMLDCHWTKGVARTLLKWMAGFSSSLSGPLLKLSRSRSVSL